MLASGSLPPGFPWTEIDGMPYWDGGLYSNTPLDVVLERVHARCDEDVVHDRDQHRNGVLRLEADRHVDSDHEQREDDRPYRVLGHLLAERRSDRRVLEALVAPLEGPLQALLAAFRTGAGVPYADYGLDLRTGQVDVNGGAFNPLAPFGGYKQSGIGREMGVAGFEEYLETKTIAEPA